MNIIKANAIWQNVCDAHNSNIARALNRQAGQRFSTPSRDANWAILSAVLLQAVEV